MRKDRLSAVLVALALVCAMSLAFCGCGDREDSSDSVTTDSLLDDPDYDINYVLVDSGLEELLNGTGVNYSINRFSDITNDVSIDTGDEEFDGVAGTFMAYAEGDTEYEELPDYRVVGNRDGIVYVLMLPTDVRYDTGDSQQCADYEKITEALKSFEIR